MDKKLIHHFMWDVIIYSYPNFTMWFNEIFVKIITFVNNYISLFNVDITIFLCSYPSIGSANLC